MSLLTAAALLLGLLASRSGVRFDGFLDLSLSPEASPVPLPIALADQFVSLPIAAGTAWLILRGFAVSARFDTVLLALGTMRVPLVLLAPVPVLIEQPVGSTPTLLLTIVAVAGFAWTLTLLVSGVRFASGLRQGRLAGAVLCITIGAELIGERILTLLTGGN